MSHEKKRSGGDHAYEQKCRQQDQWYAGYMDSQVDLQEHASVNHVQESLDNPLLQLESYWIVMVLSILPDLSAPLVRLSGCTATHELKLFLEIECHGAPE